MEQLKILKSRKLNYNNGYTLKNFYKPHFKDKKNYFDKDDIISKYKINQYIDNKPGKVIMNFQNEKNKE